MDGGSRLNLIYEETLQKMEIDWSRIERSSTTFRGIIPSREARCTGKITLDVVFGSPDNYRSEEVTFQVAPFNCGYHAILGREAFTIFQAVPHYGYMKLKMPGPGGIITLVSDPREARCTGKITLDVVFGSPDNYRSEEVTFQVAPFNCGYHAILGREAFTIFQAVPHYGYMKLKMPGPGGIITLVSDPDIALRTENKTAALALEALSEALAAEELTALRSMVNRDDVILDKRSKSKQDSRISPGGTIRSPSGRRTHCAALYGE